MSGQSKRPFLSSAIGGVVVVIGVASACIAVFVYALVQGAH